MKRISDYTYYCSETSTVIATWSPATSAPATAELIKSTHPSARRLILLDPEEGAVTSPFSFHSDLQFTPLSDPAIKDKFQDIYYVNGNAKLKECIAYVNKHYPSYKINMFMSCEFELLYRTQSSFKYNLLQEPDKTYPAKYHFISLNGVPKWERAVVLHRVLSDETKDKICYSWVLRNISNPALGKWISTWFNPHKPKILDTVPSDISLKQEQVPTQYHESLIDTFVESAPQDAAGIFVTEKTWKPLIIGKVFWGLNTPGYHNYLESLGFRLYKNLFDYSLDTITDFGVRAEMHSAEILRITAMPLHEVEALIETHRADIEHNKQLARNWEMPGYPKLLPYSEAIKALPIHIRGLKKDANKITNR